MEKFNPNKKNWEPLFGDTVIKYAPAPKDLEKPEIPELPKSVADNPVINMSCAACGNPNIRVYKSGSCLVISCSKCGTSYERPIVDDLTDLENACDILNDYEKIRYKVKKSKEDK